MEPITPLLPLTGFTVGITADRRREELTSMLSKRGARVIAARSIRIESLVGDNELLSTTESCLMSPPQIVVATTGIGFRGWIEAAEGWGRGDEVRRMLQGAELIARGPKARGAIRAVGLVEAWSPESESIGEISERLLANDLHGVRIAIQVHGEPMTDTVDALRAAGADVVIVSVYRWVPAEDQFSVARMAYGVISGQIDALLFTSAPAVRGFLDAASEAGIRDQLVDALRNESLVICVGPICAGPFAELGVPVLVPERARLGGVVRVAVEELPLRRVKRVSAAGRELEIRGHVVLVDQQTIELPPAPMAMLRGLAGRPGSVCTREELATYLPGEESGTHAVEMAVTRLRSLLGDPNIVQTVVKRGYRLACDHAFTN